MSEIKNSPMSRDRAAPCNGPLPSEMPTVTSVMIVDNHAEFGEQLATFVCDELHCLVVGPVGNAAAGLELLRATRPDVALVDVGLPRENGFRLAERLAALHPPIPVVLM